MATDLDQPRLTAEQFLQIEFGPDIKAELDNGVIRMMVGGSRDHARIQMNLYRYLGTALRGSGCRPYGSDMAIKTAAGSVRYPDLTIDRGKAGNDKPQDQILSNLRVIIEVLSPGTSRIDQGDKLYAYKAIATIDAIAFVDPETTHLRVLHRTGATAWSDVTFSTAADLELPTLGLVVPHAEMFADD
ncbi:Uma2 family endonuclease [Sphingomonas sp. PB4P5]|uniref:Uma2 family endonuclease n=1 Tax=Parasphingomonas puruogangriensis TaxID=3096155 RepID=UPI002FCA7198